jgi:drug/metabolite transporter (DMT)-like permease
MSHFEIAALAAAFFWALSAMIAREQVAHLGAIAFTRIRMAMVLAMLVAFVATSGGWREIEAWQVTPILLSGLVGIFLGDTALFLCMSRVGPRRSSIVFSTNAPMSVILGFLVLGESLSLRELAGIAIVFAGVILAIVFGKRRSQLSQWEEVKGPLWIGVGFGLLAALGQSVGALIARPVMASGADPAAVSAMRVGVSVVCFYMALAAFPGWARPQKPLTGRVAAMTALSGFLAMAVGMTLVLFALSGGNVGIVSTLSATTPAMILPMLWWKTKEIPAAGAWAGAALVIAGSWLIFTG